MAIYVTSDIHGEYDKFIRLLDKINFSDDDTLYILGDVLDRGPAPIKILLKIMEMPNVIPIVGNHELMAMECLDFLVKEITEESLLEMSPEKLDNFINWHYNGCTTTLKEFRRLDPELRDEVAEYIKDWSLFEEIEVNNTKYLLVHAGLGNYSPRKKMEDYSLYELVWERADYNVAYYPRRKNFYVISGHTPTMLIEGNPRPGYIYRHKNHIAIDCGACFKKGRLAAICLDTDEEIYVE